MHYIENCTTTMLFNYNSDFHPGVTTEVATLNNTASVSLDTVMLSKVVQEV